MLKKRPRRQSVTVSKSGLENDGDETWNICKSVFNKNPNHGSNSKDQRVVEDRRATNWSALQEPRMAEEAVRQWKKEQRHSSCFKAKLMLLKGGAGKQIAGEKCTTRRDGIME